MFGKPIKRMKGMNILLWMWTYLYKDTEGEINIDTIKSRSKCNGGPRFCDKLMSAETYAACIEQPIHCLLWAIMTALNLVCKGYNVRNAFTEAPAPNLMLYMQPNDQFNQWWTEYLDNERLAPDEVIPVLHTLQGHPESP